MNLCDAPSPLSEWTDDAGLERAGVTGSLREVIPKILPPDTPADILGARLAGWLGGLLGPRLGGGLIPKSLSVGEAMVGDDGVEDSCEVVVDEDWFLWMFSDEDVDPLLDGTTASFWRLPRVLPGCLSPAISVSGGGSGYDFALCAMELVNVGVSLFAGIIVL